MNKEKEYYLNKLSILAEHLATSDEPMFFHTVQFCELTKNTNKTYNVTVCISAFEDLPLIDFDEEGYWNWDQVTGEIRLITEPELDTLSAVMEYFSLHSDVFKHLFCLNSQVEKYGTRVQLNKNSTLKQIAENIHIFLNKESASSLL